MLSWRLSARQVVCRVRRIDPALEDIFALSLSGVPGTTIFFDGGCVMFGSSCCLLRTRSESVLFCSRRPPNLRGPLCSSLKSAIFFCFSISFNFVEFAAARAASFAF